MKTLQEMEQIAKETPADHNFQPPTTEVANELLEKIRKGDEEAYIEAMRYYTHMDYTAPLRDPSKKAPVGIILNAVAAGRLKFPGMKPTDGVPEEKVELRDVVGEGGE